MQRKVDFLIVGAKKAGTSAFYEFLRQHQDIFFPPVKETIFFADDKYYQQGESYFNSFYRGARNESILGGVDVELLFFQQTAKRIYEYNPNMKIIAMLRNPVERAYSAYWYAKRFGWEECKTFEDALSKESVRIRGAQKEQRKSYLAYGHYSKQLKYYFDVFGRDKVHFILNKNLKEYPEKTVKEILDWLEIDPDISGMELGKKVNIARTPRFKRVEKFMYNHDSWLKRIIRKSTTSEFRYYLSMCIKKPLEILNTKPFNYPPMKQDTRDYLVEYFRPWNEKLSKLIYRDMSHWNK